MKKTVITIETFQRTTIRSRKAARSVRCDQCAAEAPSKNAAHLQIAVREETCEIDIAEDESHPDTGPD